jgi:hypothetical protein
MILQITYPVYFLFGWRFGTPSLPSARDSMDSELVGLENTKFQGRTSQPLKTYRFHRKDHMDMNYQPNILSKAESE